MRGTAEKNFEHWRRSGDTAALSDVFDQIAPRLLRLAIHLVGDVAAAEDLVQTTFVVAIESAETWDASRALEPWLTGILDNRAKELLKSRRRPLEPAAREDIDHDTPLARAMASEHSRELVKAIDQLDEPYRSAMVLSVLHEMQPAAIAHALDRSPGAVRVQLHRGREMLKRLLPAGLVASTLTIVAEGRGLEAMKASVLAHAAAVTGPVGAVGIVGAVLMSKKIVAAAIALVVALLAVAFLRGYTREPLSATTVASNLPAINLDADEERVSSVTPIDEIESTRRVEVPISPRSGTGEFVKLHGRVIDGDTSAGITGADVELFAPRRTRLSDARRRWSDRMRVTWEGQPDGIEWPQIDGPISDAGRFDVDEIDVYEPPGEGAQALAHATSNAQGEFEIDAPQSLGFLVCNAVGYATRPWALTPKRINAAHASELSIVVAIRIPGALSGYVVDPDMKRIERRMRIAFTGVLSKGALGNRDASGKTVLGDPRLQGQQDTCVVETKSDGSFECALPITAVHARSLEPDLVLIKKAFVHDGKWVGKLVEPGQAVDPLVLMMKPACAIEVRNRDSHAPIEDIFLECTRVSTGTLLRAGRFFAKNGRMTLSNEAVMSGAQHVEDELNPCECTVWADHFAPVTQTLESLIAGQVTLFELEPSERFTLTGRVHDGAHAVPRARIALHTTRLLWPFPPSMPLVAMTVSDAHGNFRLACPSGRFLLEVASDPKTECRVVDLPVSMPIDVDLSIDTSIVASVLDSSGMPSAAHTVVLHGSDGRRVFGHTDPHGVERFSSLPAGRHELEVRDRDTAEDGNWRADQTKSVDVNIGEERSIEFVILATSRHARLSVDGVTSFAGWLAGESERLTKPSIAIDADGRIPIDIRSRRVLAIASPEGREWYALLPNDAPDGYVIHIALDGRGYEGVLTSMRTGEPLRGTRITAQPRDDSEGTKTAHVAVTDEQGRFSLRGLSDEPYYMWFIGTATWPEDFESLHVSPTTNPTDPPTQLAIALPFHNSENETVEGLDTIIVTGTVRRTSGTVEGIQGHIAGVLARPGYTLRVFIRTVVGLHGTYSARVPVASSYAAYLRAPATKESFHEIQWTASGAGDREVHDIDLP